MKEALTGFKNIFYFIAQINPELSFSFSSFASEQSSERLAFVQDEQSSEGVHYSG